MPYAFVGEALRKSNRRHIADNLVTTYEFRRAGKSIVRYLSENGFEDSARLLGHCVNPPGLPTIGLDGDRFVGVHLDNYVRQGASDRDGYPNRLCINVGPEARYFIFTNLSSGFVEQQTGIRPNDSLGVQRNYFRNFADYPLLRLRVEPGEAYVAAAQTLMHEGSTLGKDFFDVQVSFLGRFDPERLKSLPSGASAYPLDS